MCVLQVKIKKSDAHERNKTVAATERHLVALARLLPGTIGVFHTSPPHDDDGDDDDDDGDRWSRFYLLLVGKTV